MNPDSHADPSTPSALRDALLEWLSSVVQTADARGIYLGRFPLPDGDQTLRVAIWRDNPLAVTDDRLAQVACELSRIYDHAAR